MFILIPYLVLMFRLCHFCTLVYVGRGDYRNGDGHDRHPSGLPRPYAGSGGRGRGRGGGRGSYNSSRGHDDRHDSHRWDSKDSGDDGWGSFPGAKVQNSPGREAFPGGWAGGATPTKRSSSVHSEAGGDW